jgi:magnesium chelatase subunit I
MGAVAPQFGAGRPAFPFSALLAQERLQQALLLLAIDPRIGGVLIDGPRGTAKSTSARALADLLPGGPFVTLPLGATEEMLIGTLDIEAVLRGGEVRFAPGLLARAHGGVLYVDEVNLLPDVLVDQLLDVAASGVNVIERDGISHQHPASFALVGTMNPEEGELRPQLLDRFGLALTLESCCDLRVRGEIIKARLAFDADPVAFGERFERQQAALTAGVSRARAAVRQLAIGDEVHDRVSAVCIDAHVDGLRADLVMTRAARALAAWQGADAVTAEHVEAVADLALHHRRRAATDRPPQPKDRANAADPSSRAGTSDLKREPEPPREPERSWGELPPPALVALPAARVSLTTQKKRP